jgi:uncharacterized membrane protein YqaE (UPF0057 family)
MRLLFAFLCPPIAVLLCGKPFQGLILSPLLTLCYYVPGVIHALAVVHATHVKERRPLVSVVVNR